MVPTERIIRWKLEAMSYSWPQTFTVVSVILLLFFVATGAAAFAPLRSELCAKFFLTGRLFFAQLWCVVTRVRKSGVFFVTVNSVNIVKILSFFASGSALCVSLHGASSFSNNDALFLLRRFCILRRQFFVFSGSAFGVIFVFFGGSCSELTLWNTGAEFLPSCRRVIFSFVLKILPARNFWRLRPYFEFNLAWIFDCSRYFLLSRFLNSTLGLCSFFVDF